jgi:hypothetical protein
MTRRHDDPIASLLADGEAAPELERRRAEPAVAAEVAEIRRLSRRLRVPPEVAQPDPFFVVRFRARRDALRQAAQSGQAWRRVALRLLPLAASAVLAAVVAIVVSSERTSALGELEMTDLGGGVADVTLESTSVEPVLRIALGEL